MLKSKFFLLYLAVLSSLSPLSTDIYLSSIPILTKTFNTELSLIQLSLSLFSVSFACSLIVWGPMSDRIGRKITVFFGLFILIIGSLLCATSNSAEMLIIARVVQACGASVGVVIATAMIKDYYKSIINMTKALTVVVTITMLVPMLAPILGSFILSQLGWQFNFYLVALVSLILLITSCFVEETLPKINRKPLPINSLIHAYLEQLNCKSFLLASLGVSLNFSILFSFISTSSFIYISLYHVSIIDFGYLFAFNALGIIISIQVLKQINGKIKESLIVISAIIVCLFGAITFVLCLTLYPESLYSVAIPCFIISLGVGALHSLLMGITLRHVVSYAGLTSSIVNSSRFIMAAVVTALLGHLCVSSAMPLAIIMILLIVLTSIVLTFYFKGYAIHT